MHHIMKTIPNRSEAPRSGSASRRRVEAPGPTEGEGCVAADRIRKIDKSLHATDPGPIRASPQGERMQTLVFIADIN